MIKILNKKITLLFFLTFYLFSGPAFCSLSLYEQGKVYFEQKNYKQANILFKKAIQDNPGNVNCRYYYAQTLIYLDNIDEAQQAYEKIIEISPFSNAAKLSSIGIAKIQKYLIDKKLSYKSKTESKLNIENKIKAEVMKGIGDNYINNAISNAKIVRWDKDKFPLKILFKESDKIESTYINSVKSTFDLYCYVLPVLAPLSLAYYLLF